MSKKIFLELGIAVICLVLTLLFNFGTVAFSDPQRFEALKLDHNQLITFAAISFDLWTISFGLIVGSAVSSETSKREKLLTPTIGLILVLLALLALLTLSAVMPNFHPNWVRIWVPDILTLGLLGLASHSAMAT